MDFFEHQDVARRKTSLLVMYFLLAVVLIILSVYVVFWLVLVWSSTPPETAGAPPPPPSLWSPVLFSWIAGGTIFVVVFGTFSKILALSGGGESVARMLGAVPIEPGVQDPDQRRLINVVEEIAIASGTPIPRVFLLEDDSSINAFAAGFSIKDAVIGVTNGCIKNLSRDELQGVIAHEFSHILNGDMKLNIRLMGVLHGILILGIIGYWIFRSALYSPSSRSSGRKKEGNTLPFILLGLAVMAIGYIGVFFGKLIKSAVSRQREYLADASSVQFTRNPDGIAGALKKIGGLGSQLSHPNAEQASHMFFANGLKNSFSSLMATHPPLKERIRRLDPSFDENSVKSRTKTDSVKTRSEPSRKHGVQNMAAFAATAATAGRIVVAPEDMMNSIGKPQLEHIAYVSQLLNAIPDDVRAATHEVVGARSVLYGLLLSSDESILQKQMSYLSDHEDQDVYGKVVGLSTAISKLPPETSLPLADMALSTLRVLEKPEVEKMKDSLQKLADADNKISLFEYVFLRMMIRHIDSISGSAKQPVKYHDLNPLMRSVIVVLSLLAHYGGADEDEADMVFKRGVAELSKKDVAMLPKEDCGLEQLDAALNHLSEASPKIKKNILAASVECVTANGRTTIAEVELLRAIADSLDCPMPPFLPSREVA